VLETTYESMGEFEEAIRKVLKNQEWRGIYNKIVPLTEKGRREEEKEREEECERVAKA
jgi:L-fucose isomerase-like protein